MWGMILNLSDAPADPVRRSMWLTGVLQAVEEELDEQYRVLYFDARLGGILPEVVAAGPHSMRQALAYARAENNARRRMVRWSDGLDSSSSAYRG